MAKDERRAPRGAGEGGMKPAGAESWIVEALALVAYPIEPK
jgi:hypothetical protein